MKLINGDINRLAIASKMIEENLERSCNVTFPESEIIFITLHLLGSKMTEHTASSITF